MRVLIPSALQSYTRAAWVEAQGGNLDAVLWDLDRQYPGIRFRMIDEQGGIRRHVRVFVESEQVFRLDVVLSPTQSLHIVQALSGG